MKVDELITEAITEFLDVEINRDSSELNFASKIGIVQKRMAQKVKNNPKSYGMIDASQKYEYEMFFTSNPNDMIKIDGWIPIDTGKIEKAEKINEYIEIGLLRKIKQAAA
ncbi:hypothetical protein [Aquimarina sp. RZ0]|uniref:hypothetical protein n=1 Tax=Aquimarina sp. RZ0 TaxID=2607730 RepID=UPI0011F31007|nr:hypothetical protein [Aquimarina sp. RZ0]KAA1248151.1 hypothetical protein F0000_00710 [Aquimarina sp. RZ0]